MCVCVCVCQNPNMWRYVVIVAMAPASWATQKAIDRKKHHTRTFT